MNLSDKMQPINLNAKGCGVRLSEFLELEMPNVALGKKINK